MSDTGRSIEEAQVMTQAIAFRIVHGWVELNDCRDSKRWLVWAKGEQGFLELAEVRLLWQGWRLPNTWLRLSPAETLLN